MVRGIVLASFFLLTQGFTAVAKNQKKIQVEKLVCADYIEVEYLEINSDVAAAVRNGQFPNGLAHFDRFGRNEGRQTCKNPTKKIFVDAFVPADTPPFPQRETCTTFVEAEYLANYPDAVQGIKDKKFVSGFDHYLKIGQAENRQTCLIKKPCEKFVESDYLELNPDVAEAVKKKLFESGEDHYKKNGKFEKRKICKG